MSSSAVQEENVISPVKKGTSERSGSKEELQKTQSPVKANVRDTMEAQETEGARIESLLSSDERKVCEDVQHVGNDSSIKVAKACTLDKNFGSQINPVAPKFRKKTTHQIASQTATASQTTSVSTKVDTMANELVLTVIRTALSELLTSDSLRESLDNILSNFESDAVVEMSGIELDIDPLDDHDDDASETESEFEGEDDVVTQVVSQVIESSQTTTPSLHISSDDLDEKAPSDEESSQPLASTQTEDDIPVESNTNEKTFIEPSPPTLNEQQDVPEKGGQENQISGTDQVQSQTAESSETNPSVWVPPPIDSILPGVESPCAEETTKDLRASSSVLQEGDLPVQVNEKISVIHEPSPSLLSSSNPQKDLPEDSSKQSDEQESNDTPQQPLECEESYPTNEKVASLENTLS